MIGVVNEASKKAFDQLADAYSWENAKHVWMLANPRKFASNCKEVIEVIMRKQLRDGKPTGPDTLVGVALHIFTVIHADSSTMQYDGYRKLLGLVSSYQHRSFYY